MWYGTIEGALKEFDQLNSWHDDDWEGIERSNKFDSFWGDMDNTNMFAAYGKFSFFPYLIYIFIQLSYNDINSFVSSICSLIRCLKVVVYNTVNKLKKKDENW